MVGMGIYIVFAVIVVVVVFAMLWSNREKPIDEPGRSKSDYMYHDYKTSTDYHRLWELLHDGRRVIIYRASSPGSKLNLITDVYIKYGTIIGFWDELDGTVTENEFACYCTYNKVSFLDQVDEYNVWFEK